MCTILNKKNYDQIKEIFEDGAIPENIDKEIEDSTEEIEDKKIKYTGINIKENTNLSPKYDKQTIYIISADFSHHKLFHEAIDLENKAAKSMMFRDYSDTHYNQVVDDIRTFKYVNNIIPKNLSFQWIGRSRSEGLKGVGYLSFLIREPPNPLKKLPNGIFVTVYDSGMVSHECLGEWFT